VNAKNKKGESGGKWDSEGVGMCICAAEWIYNRADRWRRGEAQRKRVGGFWLLAASAPKVCSGMWFSGVVQAREGKDSLRCTKRQRVLRRDVQALQHWPRVQRDELWCDTC